jgi:HlyD family secretion protein
MQPWSAARPLALGILTIVFLVAGLGGWASLVTIAGAIIVPGRIEVTQDRQVVQNPDGGVVEAILVSEGEAVAVGDVLLRLDGSALRSEMVIAETRMMELATRRARLEAQRDKLAGVVFPPGVTAAAAHHPEVAEMMAGQADLFARKASAMAQARALRMTRIDQIKTEVAGLRDRAEAVETEISLLEDELSAIGNLSRRGLMPASLLSERQRELAGLTC